MKLLSIAVPCYNSEGYMRNCIESLLPGGEDVEIIIVDDGSTKDRTPEIADEYAAKYPNIVRVVHQENGGHGEAVNTGLKHATGVYFKVVDSDDWLDKENYPKVLERLSELVRSGQTADMVLCNYIYDKQGVKHKRTVRYTSALPQDTLFTWKDVKHFHLGQYILMHSVIYRTRMLQESGMELPKHTFYVDNIFVYYPLPHVKTLYYMDVALYHYFIGRADQSVNEQVMISRVDQQIKVNKIMIDQYDIGKIRNKKLRNYMVSYLSIMMTVSSIMLIRSGTQESLVKKKDLWQYLKKKDRRLYYRLYYFSIFGRSMNLPGKGGRKVSVALYKMANRVMGFN
ncbi:MAG: glycosyltransferase family 2 protein [Lachnospiraceae bacterium]|nr:glycosyltransferase family 2 protein [Lachnospiraceae bacterium]